MENTKVAIVTGASRGIGKAIAIALANEGHKVIGTATSQAGADSISDMLNGMTTPGEGKILNLSHKESIRTFCESLSETPLILVNNAAITEDNILLRMKDEEWDNVINTNLSGIFYLTRALLKGMLKARWGRVVSLSSVVACTGNVGQANYAAAKAGLIAFSKTLAIELGSRGITSNVVAPGFIETDMTKEITETQREAWLKNIPLQRLGKPEEIADAVSFLASEKARCVTGETLHVNGGLYMN